MGRINLYNYRLQELKYKKLRLYTLIVGAFLLGLLINLIIYVIFKFQIIYQKSQNKIISEQINSISSKIMMIKEFNSRVNILKHRIKIINQNEAKRDDAIAIYQQVNQITPPRVYYKKISINGNIISFNGVAASPLYVAEFLAVLRNKKGVFKEPNLITNNTNQDSSINFEIQAQIEPQLKASINGD